MEKHSKKRHSWSIINEKIAVKKTDKSFFDHRGSTIPEDIKSFFGADTLKLGESWPITLLYDNEEYRGRIVRETYHLGRARIFWTAWLSSRFNEVFSFSEKNKKISPFVVFEKISEKEYIVSLKDHSDLKNMMENKSIIPPEALEQGIEEGTFFIERDLPLNAPEWRDPDSGLTSVEEEKIIWKLQDNYKQPRTPEEANAILKKISDDLLAVPVAEKQKTFVVLSRNPTFARLVKERDGYICQICGAVGFEKERGGLYAEAHHSQELAKTRIDNPHEMYCTCPTCHRILHYGTDEEILKRSANKNRKIFDL